MKTNEHTFKEKFHISNHFEKIFMIKMGSKTRILPFLVLIKRVTDYKYPWQQLFYNVK